MIELPNEIVSHISRHYLGEKECCNLRKVCKYLRTNALKDFQIHSVRNVNLLNVSKYCNFLKRYKPNLCEIYVHMNDDDPLIVFDILIKLRQNYPSSQIKLICSRNCIIESVDELLDYLNSAETPQNINMIWMTSYTTFSESLRNPFIKDFNSKIINAIENEHIVLDMFQINCWHLRFIEEATFWRTHVCELLVVITQILAPEFLSSDFTSIAQLHLKIEAMTNDLNIHNADSITCLSWNSWYFFDFMSLLSHFDMRNMHTLIFMREIPVENMKSMIDMIMNYFRDFSLRNICFDIIKACSCNNFHILQMVLMIYEFYSFTNDKKIRFSLNYIDHETYIVGLFIEQWLHSKIKDLEMSLIDKNIDTKVDIARFKGLNNNQLIHLMKSQFPNQYISFLTYIK